MQIDVVSSIADLPSLRYAWNRLAGHNPLRSWEWLHSWAESYVPDGQLRILVGREADRIVGIAPLYEVRDWFRGNTLRFLGDGHCCTDHTSFYSLESCPNFCWEVACFLTQAPRAINWDFIRLEGILNSNNAMRLFQVQMGEQGCGSHARRRAHCWRLRLPQTWEDYYASLSKSFRRSVKRTLSRVSLHKDYSLHQVDDPDSLNFAIHWFQDLHQRQWNSRGKPGCFADRNFPAFIKTAARRLWESGKLRMLWIENSKNTPVAVDFALQSTNATYSYQTGIDPDYQHFSLGRVMTISSIKASIEAEHEIYDFLRGDYEYKARWQAVPEVLLDQEIITNRNLPKMQQHLVNFGRELKQRYTSRQTSVQV